MRSARAHVQRKQNASKNLSDSQKHSAGQIVEIAKSFPCLERKLRDWNPDEFDPDGFYDAMDCWSHGERLCGLAVLNIWNHGAAKQKGWIFDVFEFVGIADGSLSLIMLFVLIFSFVLPTGSFQPERGGSLHPRFSKAFTWCFSRN